MTNFFYYVGVSTTIICIALVLALFIFLIIRMIKQNSARAKNGRMTSSVAARNDDRFQAQAEELQKIIDFLEKKEQEVRTPNT